MKNYNAVPTICIVGRPNVGKSSLFNCLLEKRRAVVVEQSGTTRDRVEEFTSIGSSRVKLVDTGGYISEEKDSISLQVQDQLRVAIEEASIILMVTDTISGISPHDEEAAALLRKFDKPVIVVANKTDNDKLKADAAEFYQLGFEYLEEVSCLHRRGVRDLKRLLREIIGEMTRENRKQKTENRSQKAEDKLLKIAVVGRPNVGKSSFVNNLLARDRVIVSDIPGTTRDSIDTYFNYEEDEYIFIDTAGIRHDRKIKTVVDAYSIMRSKESIIRSDVVVLLLEAADGITNDDIDILNFIEENGKACLVLINKWDLAEEVGDISRTDYKEELISKYHRLGKFPVMAVSSKTGKKVLSTLTVIKSLNASLDEKVTTSTLNKIFEKNDPAEVPIPRRKRKPNFLYIVQSSSRPVEFKFFVNNPECVLPAHMTFIENRLRDGLQFLSGIPIKIWMMRAKK